MSEQRARSPIDGCVDSLIPPRVLSGLGAEIVDRLFRRDERRLLAVLGQYGRGHRWRRYGRGRVQQLLGRRLLEQRTGRMIGAGGQTIVAAVVVVQALELGALVAHGELHARGVDGQRQMERERVVDGRDVLHGTGRGRTRHPVSGHVPHGVVLHVRALRVLVRDPLVLRAPDEHILVVGQVPHFDRALDPVLRRLDDHVLQRYVAHVQPFPEVQVTGGRLREADLPVLVHLFDHPGRLRVQVQVGGHQFRRLVRRFVHQSYLYTDIKYGWNTISNGCAAPKLYTFVYI